MLISPSPPCSCVDIVVKVPELPPADDAYRWDLLRQLTAAPPPQEQWEVSAYTASICDAACAVLMLSQATARPNYCLLLLLGGCRWEATLTS